MNSISNLSIIEEEVINFLEKSRNKFKESNNKSSFDNRSYFYLKENDFNFQNTNKVLDKQNLNSKLSVCTQSLLNSTVTEQDLIIRSLKSNIYELKDDSNYLKNGKTSNNLNGIITNISMDEYLFNKKDLNDKFKNSCDLYNYTDELYSKEMHNNLHENNFEINNLQSIPEALKDQLTPDRVCINVENSCASKNNTLEVRENIDDYYLNVENCERLCRCLGKTKSTTESDEELSSMTLYHSDEDLDIIEEIIVREKINIINNDKCDNRFSSVSKDIILKSSPNLEKYFREKVELKNLALKINEAIEYNVSLRNSLYDLEYALLNLVEKKCAIQNKYLEQEKKTKSRLYNKQRFYNKFQAPYFKDKRGISCAKYVNEDIRSVNDLDCSEDYMRLYRQLNHPELSDVYRAIKCCLNEKNNKMLDNERERKSERRRGRKRIRCDNVYNETDIFAIDSLKMDINEQIDWLKVSSFNLNGITSVECKQIWTLILKPYLQLGSWHEDETQKLLTIAECYKYQDWDKIARVLGNGRTAYLCFCHVISKQIQDITHNAGVWTTDEDDFLLRLIQKCKYGNAIMWNRILYYFDDRSVTQVINRWYRLNPSLKRGKYTHNEDVMLMYCVQQFGRDFGKIASLFGNRSPIQLRERYFAITDLIKENKLGEWSIDEDRLLLQLVNNYGESKWSEIAGEFPGRNRTQIRHRYTSVLKRWLNEPTFKLETLKRHKRTTHIKSVKRVKEIDTTKNSVRTIIKNKLKTGKVTLKREKKAGKKSVG